MPTPTFTTGMDCIHHNSISISPPPQTVHWCTVQSNGKLCSAPKTNHIVIDRWVEAPTTWTIDRDLYPFPVVIVESSVQLNELKMIIFVNNDTIQIPIKYLQIALPNNKTAYIITRSKVRLPKPQMVSVAIETSCGFWSNSIEFVTTTKPPPLPFNAGISNNFVSVFQAAVEGRIIRVKECVDRGLCNVNAKDEDGRPALVYAALYNQISVVEHLLLNRAEVDSVDEYDGETALHKAAFLKHVEICHLLLIYGASTSKQNAEGVTPQDFAKTVGLDLEALSRVSCLVSPSHITPCKNSIILIRSRLLHKLDGVPTVKFGEATGNVLGSSPSAIEVMCPAMETLGKITVTILSSTQGLQFDMVIDEAQVAPYSEIHSVCMLPSYSFEEKKVASQDLFDLDNFPMEDEYIIPEPMHGRERAMATTDMGTFVYPRKLSSPVSLGELPLLMSSSPEKTTSPLRRNSSASQYQQLMVQQQKLFQQMMGLNNPAPEPHPHQAKVYRTQSLPADQFHAAMEGQYSRSLDDTQIQSAMPPLLASSRGRSLDGPEYPNLANLNNNNEVKKPRLERGRSMSDVHNRKKSIGKGRIRTGSFSSGSPIPSPPRKLSDPYPCTFHLFEQPSPTQRKSYPREPRYFSPNPVTVLATCPYTIDSGWVTVRAVHATDLNDFSQNVLGEAEITQPLDEGKKAQFSLRCIETTKKQYVRLKFIVHYVSNQQQCEEIIYSDAFVISSHPKKKNEQGPM